MSIYVHNGIDQVTLCMCLLSILEREREVTGDHCSTLEREREREYLGIKDNDLSK